MWRVFSLALASRQLAWGDLPAAGSADDPVLTLRRAMRARGGGPTLPRATVVDLLALLPRAFWASGALLALSLVGTLGSPLALGRLLAALDGTGGARAAWPWAVALFGCAALSAVTIHRFWYLGQRVGLHSQAALQAALLVKAI